MTESTGVCRLTSEFWNDWNMEYLRLVGRPAAETESLESLEYVWNRWNLWNPSGICRLESAV